jgi:uncharacterized coiled-coil DUF342 family protein
VHANATTVAPVNEKVEAIKKSIDEEKKKRFAMIDDIKRIRRKLSFKKAEQAALSKLIEIDKDNSRKIGYLIRLKEKLEFKISTETTTLNAEKDLVRKINEVNAELDHAIKSRRLKKRVELIGSDIEELSKQIEEKEKLIKDSEKKLDDLYSNLRSIMGRSRPKVQRERQRNAPKQQEISLADIAIIKEKNGNNFDNSAEENEDIESN